MANLGTNAQPNTIDRERNEPVPPAVRQVQLDVQGSSVHVLSATGLYVTAPAHPTGVFDDVRVYISCGTSAIHTADGFTYS